VNIKIITKECIKMCHFKIKTSIFLWGTFPTSHLFGVYGASILAPSAVDLERSVPTLTGWLDASASSLWWPGLCENEIYGIE